MQHLASGSTRSISDLESRPPDNFDAIRLIAALVVLYGHAFPLTGSALPPIFGNHIATIAVKVFFVRLPRDRKLATTYCLECCAYSPAGGQHIVMRIPAAPSLVCFRLAITFDRGSCRAISIT